MTMSSCTQALLENYKYYLVTYIMYIMPDIHHKTFFVPMLNLSFRSVLQTSDLAPWNDWSCWTWSSSLVGQFCNLKWYGKHTNWLNPFPVKDY